MALASPGVLVKEVDFTATVNVADQNIGVVAIDALRGPTDVVTYISSERELVEIFGKPNSYNYESWFAASTMIQYGAVVAVIRPAVGTNLGLNNSNIKTDGTSDSALLIKNKDDYETRNSNTYEWAARTAGTFNNGISVAVVDHGADQRVRIARSGEILTVTNTAGTTIAGEADATYTGVTSATGQGTGAELTITRDENGDINSVTVTKGGTGYNVGNALDILGSSIGGADGTDDIVVNVSTVGTAAPAAGAYVQWTDSAGNVQKGNVFRVTNTDWVEITLWDTTKRLTGTETLYDADGTTILGVCESLLSNDVYGELEYETGRKWSSLAPQPGTSFGVAEAGGRYDEFHIAIIDTDGSYSGTKKQVLETLTFVSKASDAKSAEGDTLYWKTVVSNNSSYVYAGDQTFVISSEELNYDDGSTGTGVSIGSPRLDAVFRLFQFGTDDESVKSSKLSGGKDYNWSGNASGVADAIVKGYDLVEDREIFGDIDFLVPGKITAAAAVRLIAIAEKRRDCIVVVSPLRGDVINSNTSTKKTDDIIDFFKTLPSTSYAIYDSGYKYIYDKYNDVYRYVPCAADVAGLCFSTTINSETWFSPAGYNRGQVRNATKLAYSPKQAERDRLYTNRVNPIVAFPGQGIVLFGDKTALASPSAFDRINVRRLFIELEKNIAQFSKYQLFELNDELTRSGFRSAIEPYLRGIQGRRGIYDFLVVCDTSNNTGDVIDRNELVAEIYIKPARSINFITISFIATRTGVSFNELIN